MKRASILAASILIAINGCAPLAQLTAQTNSWIRVKALRKNTEVIVTRKTDGRVIGFVESVTDDTVVIDSDDGTFVIGKDNIKEIFYAEDRDEKKSLNRGALFGLLGGLASGMAYATVRDTNGQSNPGVMFLLIGGGIGTLAGRYHAKGKDKGALIYSAK